MSSQPTVSTSSLLASAKTNVNELITDAVNKGAVSVGNAIAARESGYLNSYIYRVPGSSGYSSHITSPVLSGTETVKETVITTTSVPTTVVEPDHHYYTYAKPARYSWNTTNYTSSNVWTSPLEREVIEAKTPLQLSGSEHINVGKYSGIYVNKHEAENWSGPVPLNQYKINDDDNPEVIKKKLDRVHYEQVCGIRYLQPPAAPRPGDLIIREKARTLPYAPPLVIRQEGERSFHQEAVIYREEPPAPPARIPEQVIELETQQAAVAPPRRVVVEKLGSLPPKPADVIVERWLPYKQQKRRVVYQRRDVAALPTLRNVIIEWEAPDVSVQKVCKDLGVFETDPVEYIRKYGSELKKSSELPTCQGHTKVVTEEVKVTAAPVEHHCCCHGHHCGYGYSTTEHHNGHHHHSSVVYGAPTHSINHSVHHSTTDSVSVGGHAHIITARSANYSDSLPELEGDVDALRLVDLDRHGLSEYKPYVSAVKHISL